MENSLLHQARGCFKSQESFARAICATRNQVKNWLNGFNSMPLSYAYLIEEATHGKVSAHKLIEVMNSSTTLCYANKRAAEYINRKEEVMYNIEHISLDVIQIPEMIWEDYQRPLSSDQVRPPLLLDQAYGLISSQQDLADHKLVYHRHRLPCVIIDLKQLLLDPNVFEPLITERTLSEKAALGMALERFIGSQQGRRNDLKKDKKSDQPRENFPEVKKGRNTEKIAYILQLGNRKSYEHLKKIIQNGIPELIQVVDQKQLPIYKAYPITTLEKTQQKEALNALINITHHEEEKTVYVD